METKMLSEKQMALHILKRRRKDWAEYLEECEQAWKDGYRPHYCFHGTNQWTDYDNICGYCEETGNRFDYLFELSQCLREANRLTKLQTERVNLLIQLRTAHAPIDFDEFIKWVREPLTVTA